MMVIFCHEMKMNWKNLIIWTLCVGGLCFGCILLYTSLEDSIQEMADAYSRLGAMSTALGMDKMSLATLDGFYATEIALMHGLGGAMFAAITGITLLSKEETGHTAEFLNVLPLGRKNIFIQKYAALAGHILLFNAVCFLMHLSGYLAMNEHIPLKELLLYFLIQLLMQLETGSLCFAISAFTRKSLTGAGLGLVLLLYAADLMCRIVPALEGLKYITPFYYSGAPDIFTGNSPSPVMVVLGCAVTVISFLAAFFQYCTKDLAA